MPMISYMRCEISVLLSDVLTTFCVHTQNTQQWRHKRHSCVLHLRIHYYSWTMTLLTSKTAGNVLWFCQKNKYLFLFLFFVFFRRQGFRMITFDRQAGPLQNFNRSHVMVIGRSVSFSDPAWPPGGGVGRPKHPKILCMRFSTPGTFLKNIFSEHSPNPRAIINNPNNCSMTYRL